MSVIVTAFTIGLWCSLWGVGRSGATNFTIHQEVNSSLYACSGKGTCSVMETLIRSTHVTSTLTWTSGEMTKNTRLFQLYSVKVKALWRYLKCCEFLLLIVYTHFPSVLILGFLTEVLNCIILISFFYSLKLNFYQMNGFNYSIYKTRHSISGN